MTAQEISATPSAQASDPHDATRLMTGLSPVEAHTMRVIFPGRDLAILRDLFKDYLPYDKRINDILQAIIMATAILARKGREQLGLSQGLWQEIKQCLPNNGDVTEPTTSAWFTGHIILEKIRAVKESRDVGESILGESGIWGYVLRIANHASKIETAPDSRSANEKIAEITAGVLAGLLEAKNANQRTLRDFYNRFCNILFPDIQFDNRMTSNTWISKSVLSGQKEWRMVFPARADRMSVRTDEEMHSVLIIRNVNGDKRYYRLNTTDIYSIKDKSFQAMQLNIFDFLEREGSPNRPAGRPVFEIELVIEDPDAASTHTSTFEDRQDIVGTSDRAPVVRSVLFFKKNEGTAQLEEYTAWAPHLTGNENHIRAVLDKILEKTPALNESRLEEDDENQPEILWHRSVESKTKLAEAYTSFRLTNFEMVLLKLLKQELGIGLASILAMTSSALSKETTYMCVNPPYDAEQMQTGDLGIIPSPGTKTAKVFELLDQMFTHMQAIEGNQQAADAMELYEQFVTQLKLHMDVVNKNIELARLKKPLLAAIESNVAFGATQLLGKLFPAANRFLARATSQISSVQQRKKNLITFISANSIDSALSIGANSIQEKKEVEQMDKATGELRRVEKTFSYQILTLRKRFKAEQDDSIDLEAAKQNTQTTADEFRAMLKKIIFASLLAAAKTEQQRAIIKTLIRFAAPAKNPYLTVHNLLAIRASELLKEKHNS